VVTATALSRLGQARPGQEVRFRKVSVPEAVDGYRSQRRSIALLRSRVANAFASLRIPTHTDTTSTQHHSVPQMESA
ncbi:MAG TPA: allophanate hydrolase, partial [Mycobacterium sp.]|nr:allophanate hydrolase [Mycobacterium sp.]